MIRRNTTGPGGQASWVLVSQVDHAQLSGQLAEAWEGLDLRDGSERDQLISAIYHHDDGWAEWEENQQIDARTGRPRQFTEMDLSDSLNIWTRSIEAAAAAGPLAGYAVAGHFIDLRRTSVARNDEDTPDALLARHWTADFEARQTEWLAAWQSTGQDTDSYEVGQIAVATLRFFDVLSLWLCCAERTNPAEFCLPDNSQVTLTPKNADRVTVSPWPFADDELDFSVPGRAVLARAYRDADDLANADGATVTVHWRLTMDWT